MFGLPKDPPFWKTLPLENIWSETEMASAFLKCLPSLMGIALLTEFMKFGNVRREDRGVPTVWNLFRGYFVACLGLVWICHVFWIDLGVLEDAGVGFGTFVDPTLLLGILLDFWAICGQIGPKLWKCVLSRFGGLGGRWSRFWHCLWYQSTFWDSFWLLGLFLPNWTNFLKVCFTSIRWVWRSLVSILAPPKRPPNSPDRSKTHFRSFGPIWSKMV